MYSEFGLTLGEHPRIADEELNGLSVAILPLPGGEFYHYGTSRELISSTLAVQNLVNDQREIMHRKVKPHPAMFVQNADVAYRLTADNSEIWIENSCVGKEWNIHRQTIITGVPTNDWKLNVPSGVCIDVVPLGEAEYVARPYGFNDTFKGVLTEERTIYQGISVREWLSCRKVAVEEIDGAHDLQTARLFPVCSTIEELGLVMRWMISEPELQEGKEIWKRSRRLSADEISAYANLRRLAAQRDSFRVMNWPVLAREGLTAAALAKKQQPHLSVYSDQIVWGRSPVRIDLAGGWTDTPPYCLNEGGNVVNIAIELNGQPPLQVYVKPCKEYKIILRSIDLGAIETVTTYEELSDFMQVGSPFFYS